DIEEHSRRKLANSMRSIHELTCLIKRAMLYERNMETVLDKDLRDDLLKLVRYKILFVRREYEVAFPEQEDIVSDNMDRDAFSAWKVAEFIQDLHRGETPVPARWEDQNYPPPEFRK